MQGPLRPVRLHVEGQQRPEPCLTAGPTPRLAWQAEAADGASGQSLVPVEAEPEVHAADGRTLWAPGPLPLPAHATTRLAVPAEAALPSGTECSWRVRLRSADGAWGPWSDWHGIGSGLGDGDWAASWITREPGGRAPLRTVVGQDGTPELRWHGTPFLPLPDADADVSGDFTLDAELRPVLGACGIAFHTAGPGTGLLLELGPGDRVALRPLPRWEQPCEPADWHTEPLAEASLPTAGPRAVDRHPDGRVRPGESAWRRLEVEARGGRLAVAVDGVPVLDAGLPAPAGSGVALHAAPRAEGALRRLSLTPHRFGYGSRRDSALSGTTTGEGLDAATPTTPFRQPDEWTLLRTEAELAGPVSRAVLYAAARHQAWVHVGGREVLALSSFGYPGEDAYDAADVTEALQAAGPRMAIGALVHWYGPGQGRAPGHPGFLAELRVEYEDGRRDTFATGPDWRAAEAPCAQAGYRNDEGDPIEHALAPLPAGWDRPGFAEGPRWSPAVVLGTHPQGRFPALHPRRAHVAEERVEPVRWLTADDGTPVADFGAVRAMRPRAVIQDGAGVRLRAGYGLRSDGRVDEARTPSQNTDMSFLAGPGGAAPAPGSEPTCWAFDARVHLGFRYLELEPAVPGLGAQTPVGTAATQVSAAVVRAAHPAEARVETSAPELNSVLALLQESALHGVQERFMDTPTREKGQFLADAVNISLATMAAFGEREFTRQALREFAWSGERYWSTPAERGRVNAVYPNGDGKRDIPDFSLMLPEWAEAYWLHTGDDAFIAELLPTLEATCSYALRAIPASGPCAGLVTELPGGGGAYLHGIVDWPAPNRFGYDMGTAARTAVNAQAYAALASTARLADALGRDGLAERLRSSAAALAAAMEARLRVSGVLVDGLYADGSPSGHASQHATAMPLAVGATASGLRAADARRAEGLGLRMGPMTWHRLLAGLVSEGLVDEALGIVLDDRSRGPLAWLDAGATFAWESWELVEGTDYSQSHAWAAATWPVLVDGVLGLRRAAPGRFELSPPPCRLDWARAELPLEQGTLRVAWRRGDAGVELECELPIGTEARVALPGAAPDDAGRSPREHGADDAGRRLLGPGRHTLALAPIP